MGFKSLSGNNFVDILNVGTRGAETTTSMLQPTKPPVTGVLLVAVYDNRSYGTGKRVRLAVFCIYAGGNFCISTGPDPSFQGKLYK
jgi:hypothetical protein